jgi:hypothetical protein
MGKRTKRANLKPPGKCAFCGAGHLTREHVWADWLKPYVPRTLTHTSQAVSRSAISMFSDHRIHSQGKGILTGPGDPHSKRLRIVCGTCNSGWMSQLQEQAKPLLIQLIAGNWPNLSPHDQRVLAAWATMFTMVVEFADLNTLVTPFSQRDEFRQTRVPPKGWAVWIGRFDGFLWRGVFNHFGWRPPLVVTGAAPSPAVALTAKLDSQSTAFVLGKVFFQTFSTIRTDPKIQERAFADRFGLRCIWPVSDNVVVRPDHILDDITADKVSSSLQPFPPNMVRRAWDAPV